MYSTSQKWKEKIYGNVKSILNIYIDNVPINSNYILDFKVGKTLFDDEELKLGSTSSRYIELKIYKNQVPKTISKVKVDYGILIDNEYEIIPIGIFNVDDYTDNDDNTITLKCIDNMSKFEFNYDGSKLIYPATLKQVLEDICEKAEVELGSTSFLNYDRQISVYDNTITARDYLSYISECAGGFACIGRDGKLYIRTFYQDEQEIFLELFGEYKWGEKYKISKLSYENGVESFKFGDDTGNNLWINQENIYVTDEKQVESIYNQINGLEAYSFEGKTIIDPALDEGDKIIIDGKPIIYQGEADFHGRFITEISSKIAIREKQETTVKESSQKLINRRVQSRIDETEGKITQLVEENTDFSNKLTNVTQNIDSIEEEISRIYYFEKTVSGINELLLEDALKVNLISFRAKAKSIKGIYPNKKLFPSKSLFPKKGGTTITILLRTYSRYVEPSPILPSLKLYPNKKLFPKPKIFETKEFEFYIKRPLRSYKDKSDEFVIEIENETGFCVVKILRYVDYNNGEYTIYEEPREEILDKIDIELYKGNNYISIKEFTDWDIEATYLFNNELNKEFAPRVESNAKIRKTADEINLEVSKKAGKDELVSLINISPETIKIKSSKIQLEGVTTINNGFSIDEKGNASISNGAVKINEKGIEMSSGTKILGGEGMLTQFLFNGYGQVGHISSIQWVERVAVYIPVYIPKNFVITDAVLYGQHTPSFVWKYDNGAQKLNCYARNVKLYKTNSKEAPDISNGTVFDLAPNYEGTVVSNLGSTSGKTFAASNSEEFNVSNIKEFLQQGFQYLYLADYINNPSNTDDFESYQKSGMIDAHLFVTGYLKS
ncbi:MAG: hypothetical protein UE116_06440 [Clostridia bacterium]|jgi:hypothetical protein|nr:hypothetical protein [Clostridia bacterium]